MERTVILVEGDSDRAALEAAAGVLGIDLSSTSILVMNGATNVVRQLGEMIAKGVRVAGLYDVGEKAYVLRAMSDAGMTEGRDPKALTRFGFFECDDDLESEMIRALGAARVISVIATQGDDLRRFRRLQQMPEWRGRRVEDQLRRWFGSGSRRKIRYATLLVRAMDVGEIPQPLRQVLEYAVGRQTGLRDPTSTGWSATDST
jgi:Overcoming lysogenization defect protein-like, TOPRIM domain